MSFYVDNDWWSDHKYPSLMSRKQREQRITELKSRLRTRIGDSTKISSTFGVDGTYGGQATVTNEQMIAFNKVTTDIRQIKRELDDLVAIHKSARRKDRIVAAVAVTVIVLAIIALSV